MNCYLIVLIQEKAANFAKTKEAFALLLKLQCLIFTQFLRRAKFNMKSAFNIWITSLISSNDVYCRWRTTQKLCVEKTAPPSKFCPRWEEISSSLVMIWSTSFIFFASLNVKARLFVPLVQFRSMTIIRKM